MEKFKNGFSISPIQWGFGPFLIDHSPLVEFHGPGDVGACGDGVEAIAIAEFGRIDDIL